MKQIDIFVGGRKLEKKFYLHDGNWNYWMDVVVKDALLVNSNGILILKSNQIARKINDRILTN